MLLQLDMADCAFILRSGFPGSQPVSMDRKNLQQNLTVSAGRQMVLGEWLFSVVVRC